jgi:hypothetical protein
MIAKRSNLMSDSDTNSDCPASSNPCHLFVLPLSSNTIHLPPGPPCYLHTGVGMHLEERDFMLHEHLHCYPPWPELTSTIIVAFRTQPNIAVSGRIVLVICTDHGYEVLYRALTQSLCSCKATLASNTVPSMIADSIPRRSASYHGESVDHGPLPRWPYY